MRLRQRRQPTMTFVQAKQRGPSPAPLAAPSDGPPATASGALLAWQLVSGALMLMLLATFIVIYRCERRRSCCAVALVVSISIPPLHR
jgi:hypothetical protein